ncbi:MAG: bifunctional riboflavin kinase/FAD synthetase [PVC group bacterium]
MITIYEFTEGAITRGFPLVMACGFFDGVHRGHQALLRASSEEARNRGGKAVALSFSPHPQSVIQPGKKVRLLTSREQKIRLFEAYGLDGCILLDFSEGIRRMKPEDFIGFLRGEFPHLAHLVGGGNWRFGAGNRGDAVLLGRIAESNGLGITAVDPVTWEGEPISSSRIRRAVADGDLRSVHAMLGRPFQVIGRVRHGHQIGRRLGFPTANIQPDEVLLLPAGIYATLTLVDGGEYPSVTYIGRRPTFEDTGGDQFIEVFIMDQELDLYGRELEVSFIKKIREDKMFDSPEALSRQIARDVEEARSILAESVSGREA